MVENPETLIEDFFQAARRAGLPCGTSTIAHEAQCAPHKPHALPSHKCAVYVFSLSGSHGERCPAGAYRVLKVGKVGPKSSARFHSQHYNPNSARSNLAKTLLESRILWPYLGITELAAAQVGRWIRENTDRDHFYLDAADSELLDPLEKYMRARLNPVFEGG